MYNFIYNIHTFHHFIQLILSNFCSVPTVLKQFFTGIIVGAVDFFLTCVLRKCSDVEEETMQAA